MLIVLQKMDAILDRTGAKARWLGSVPSNRVLDVEQNEEFYKVWSVLQFLFCLPESQQALPDEDTFGHGFAWAGCSIIHMLQQRNRFDLFDFSYYTLAAMELDASLIKGIDGTATPYTLHPTPNYTQLHPTTPNYTQLHPTTPNYTLHALHPTTPYTLLHPTTPYYTLRPKHPTYPTPYTPDPNPMLSLQP